MMKSEIFPTGWLAIDLPGYRECNDTYCFVPYKTLPPLDETLFHGEFQWLTALAPQEQQAMDIHQQVSADTLNQTLKTLLTSAKEFKVDLPTSFVKFMSSPALQAQIPSCTACYFDLSDCLIKNPLKNEDYFIRFLNDQQGVLFWYLYLNGSGQAGVVVSPIPLDKEVLEEIPTEILIANIGFCGDSFESFLYRFWLENSIWFALTDNKALSEAQSRYLNHYQQPVR